jgi:hypothetical protein
MRSAYTVARALVYTWLFACSAWSLRAQSILPEAIVAAAQDREILARLDFELGRLREANLLDPTFLTSQTKAEQWRALLELVAADLERAGKMDRQSVAQADSSRILYPAESVPEQITRNSVTPEATPAATAVANQAEVGQTLLQAGLDLISFYQRHFDRWEIDRKGNVTFLDERILAGYKKLADRYSAIQTEAESTLSQWRLAQGKSTRSAPVPSP